MKTESVKTYEHIFNSTYHQSYSQNLKYLTVKAKVNLI